MSCGRGNDSQTRLYIGCLSPDTRDTDIELEFQQFGRVREVDVKRGFAFVEYFNHGDAEVARRRMDGVPLHGSSLSVEFARQGPRRLIVRQGGLHEELRGVKDGTYKDFERGGRGGVGWGVARAPYKARGTLDDHYVLDLDSRGGFIERKMGYSDYPAYACLGPPPPPRGRAPVRDYDRRQVCYNCGREGHFARECREGDWRNKCYACGQTGHIRSQCPNAERYRQGSPSPNNYHSRSQSPQIDVKRGSSPKNYRQRQRRRLSPSPLQYKRRNRGDRSPSPLRNKGNRTLNPIRNRSDRSPSPLKNRGNKSPSPIRNGGDKNPSPIRNRCDRSPGLGYRGRNRRSPSPLYRHSPTSPPRKYDHTNCNSASSADDSPPSPSTGDRTAGMHEEEESLPNDWTVDDHDSPAATDHNTNNNKHKEVDQDEKNPPVGISDRAENRCNDDHVLRDGGHGEGEGDVGTKSPPATSSISPNTGEPYSSEDKSASDVSLCFSDGFVIYK